MVLEFPCESLTIPCSKSLSRFGTGQALTMKRSSNMKKTNITISYDDEKLNALKLYLGQKDTQVEDELTRALETLYNKTVPAGVRDFIEMRSGENPAPAPKPPRRPKPAPSDVGAAEPGVQTNG